MIAISNENTRLRIEAHALLAVVYIRNREFQNAKIHIQKTIQNISNIKSKNRRKIFYEKIILRFEEESILSGAKLDFQPHFDIDEIQKKAIELVRTENEESLLSLIGNSLPESSLNYLNDIRTTTLLQIPYDERLALPPPEKPLPSSIVGKRACSALKLVLWRTLCDKNDELYKGWSGNVAIFYKKPTLALAVSASFAEAKIGSTLLVAGIVAFLFRIGCNAFCEGFAPNEIMKRNK